jgi:hypothetical protein
MIRDCAIALLHSFADFKAPVIRHWRLIPLSQVDQYLGLAGQIQNGAGFEFFGS